MQPCPKTKPIRLSPANFRKLNQEVLERDNHACLITGLRVAKGTPTHHIVYRSNSGSDVSSNLATLHPDEIHYLIHHKKGGLKDVVNRIIDRFGEDGLLASFNHGRFYNELGFNTSSDIYSDMDRVNKNYTPKYIIQYFLLGLVAEREREML